MATEPPGIHSPDWPLPAGVEARYTTREGGVSAAPWDSFNLGDACGDDAQAVAANRRRLIEEGGLPAAPQWLRQVHGRGVLRWPQPTASCREADASVTTAAGVVCVVLAADCLPVLFCREDGGEVAAAHAGWRGLAGGVLDATVAAMAAPPAALHAWLGPCIGPRAFQVRGDVRSAFLDLSTEDADAFIEQGEGHWLADLAELAERRLRRLGLRHVRRSGACTYSQPAQYFSHRRDGISGRQAALIWRR